jgi:hypothetical protein
VLSYVKDPTLYRKLSHRWRQGCQPHAPAALLLRRNSIGEPQGLMRLEGLGVHEQKRMNTINMYRLLYMLSRSPP